MIEKYQQLFQLDVYHTYFSGNICRCLVFNADAATERLIKRFSFVIRTQINGIGLYINTGVPLDELFAEIEQATGQDAFGFEIKSNNPDFIFFTDLPLQLMGQLLYHSSNTTLADQNVQLNQQFSTQPDALCAGKIILRFADILKFKNQAGFSNFEIRLGARATQWQYYIISKSALPLHDPVVLGKAPIDFEGPESVVMETGENALLFSSGRPIPLNEKPIYRFDLVNRPVTTGNQSIRLQIIIKGLPVPMPQRMVKVTVNAKEMLASPVYVYL